MFLFFFCLAVLSIGLRLGFSKQAREKNKRYEVALLYMLFWTVGMNGIFSFYGHVFLSDEIARDIGWPTGNPFQFEVGMADLAFGVLGILYIWFKKFFWLATIIGSGIFLIGDGIGHIYQEVVKKDYAFYNAGFVLYFCFIVPVVLSILYFLYLKNTVKSGTISR